MRKDFGDERRCPLLPRLGDGVPLTTSRTVCGSGNRNPKVQRSG